MSPREGKRNFEGSTQECLSGAEHVYCCLARLLVTVFTSSGFQPCLLPAWGSLFWKPGMLGFLPEWDISSSEKNLSPVVNAALAEKASQMPAPAPDTKLAVNLFQHKPFILPRAGGFPFPCPRHHVKWDAVLENPSFPFLSGPIPAPQLTNTVLWGGVAFCNTGIKQLVCALVWYQLWVVYLFLW